MFLNEHVESGLGSTAADQLHRNCGGLFSFPDSGDRRPRLLQAFSSGSPAVAAWSHKSEEHLLVPAEGSELKASAPVMHRSNCRMTVPGCRSSTQQASQQQLDAFITIEDGRNRERHAHDGSITEVSQKCSIGRTRPGRGSVKTSVTPSTRRQGTIGTHAVRAPLADFCCHAVLLAWQVPTATHDSRQWPKLDQVPDEELHRGCFAIWACGFETRCVY